MRHARTHSPAQRMRLCRNGPRLLSSWFDQRNHHADLEERLQPHQIISQIGHLERQRDEIDSAIQRLRATRNHLLQGVAA